MGNEDVYITVSGCFSLMQLKTEEWWGKMDGEKLNGRMEGWESDYIGRQVQKEWQLWRGGSGLTPEPKELAAVEDYS